LELRRPELGAQSSRDLVAAEQTVFGSVDAMDESGRRRVEQVVAEQRAAGSEQAAPRGVVGFEVILGVSRRC
jgi:hypothetical protein